MKWVNGPMVMGVTGPTAFPTIMKQLVRMEEWLMKTQLQGDLGGSTLWG